ncbi:MAG: glycosyltransferase family 4 protein [bacterium]
MKIAYIAAGAGGMYCGSCIHDNTLAMALQRKGHEVALVPTYAPIRTDEENVSIDRIFYGGLNVYLEEKFSLFRHTPGILDRRLDRPTLLNWLSKKSSSTDAKDLGSLTVSVLQGEEGNQRKELQKLIRWLKEEYKPDLVQLTNSMFLGFAREIKKALNVPVICGVQGEDLFLEELIEPYKSQAHGLLQERAKDADGFIATGSYYAGFMRDYLQVNSEKMHAVDLGINLEGHGNGDLRLKTDSFVIGYLARVCPEKGLHLLIEAFHKLWKKAGPDRIHLKIAGYLGKKDRAYFKKLQQQIADWNMQEAVEYIGEVDRLSKIVFLNSLDVLSVPTVYVESKGIFVLEALANGVPVVQPQHGSFPEIIEKTGGGFLVEPHSPEDLARGLEYLMNDGDCRERLGQQGKEFVHRSLNADKMAEATLAVYEKYLKH